MKDRVAELDRDFAGQTALREPDVAMTTGTAAAGTTAAVLPVVATAGGDEVKALDRTSEAHEGYAPMPRPSLPGTGAALVSTSGGGAVMTSPEQQQSSGMVPPYSTAAPINEAPQLGRDSKSKGFGKKIKDALGIGKNKNRSRRDSSSSSGSSPSSTPRHSGSYASATTMPTTYTASPEVERRANFDTETQVVPGERRVYVVGEPAVELRTPSTDAFQGTSRM